MEYKIFFTTDNKSGWKCRENLLKKNYPEIHKKLVEFIFENRIQCDSFKEMIWLFINNIKVYPKCYCGNRLSFMGDITKGFTKNCSKNCSYHNLEQKTKRDLTNLEKYGVKRPLQNKEVFDKLKKTNLEKYGVEHQISSCKTRTNIEKTNIKKYGFKSAFQNKEIINKIKKTNLEKYGVENVFSSEKIIDKLKKTNLEKYGVEYYLQSEIRYKKAIEKYFKVKYDDYAEIKNNFKIYKKNVRKITSKQNISLLINYNKRGKSGINNAYQLDHKYSIFEGFQNNISEEIIGNINNLEFIPWEENLKKNIKCSIKIEELLKWVKQ